MKSGNRDIVPTLPYAGQSTKDITPSSGTGLSQENDPLIKELSVTSSLSSDEETSLSLNLINNSAAYLYSTMKAQNDVRDDSVKNICACAKQLQGLIKLKSELIKLKKARGDL